MPFFRLNAERGGQFRRYKKLGDGTLKALVFEPGQVTCVLDEDLDALEADDLASSCLAEVSDQEIISRGFVFANIADIPRPKEEDEGDAGQITAGEPTDKRDVVDAQSAQAAAPSDTADAGAADDAAGDASAARSARKKKS
jgi:hypothetical protein